MTKRAILIIFGTCLFIFSLLMFSLPRKVQAYNSGKKYLGTTCQSAGTSWRCNDCTSGTTTCGDNACLDCKPPQQ